jgi:hypothetical protein
MTVYEIGKGLVPPPKGYKQPAPDPAAVLAAERAEALAYLASTDWMVVRSVEQGEPLDADVRAKRAAARAKASS